MCVLSVSACQLATEIILFFLVKKKKNILSKECWKPIALLCQSKIMNQHWVNSTQHINRRKLDKKLQIDFINFSKVIILLWHGTCYLIFDIRSTYYVVVVCDIKVICWTSWWLAKKRTKKQQHNENYSIWMCASYSYNIYVYTFYGYLPKRPWIIDSCVVV